MSEFTPISALIGGGIIGLAAVVLFLSIGKIAGISGIVSGVIATSQKGTLWRWLFVIGLIVGCFLSFSFSGISKPITPNSPTLYLIVAGLLVGIGTVVGSGCTSGHGVCGISRFSLRSLVATIVFIFFGMLTASLVGAFA